MYPSRLRYMAFLFIREAKEEKRWTLNWLHLMGCHLKTVSEKVNPTSQYWMNEEQQLVKDYKQFSWDLSKLVNYNMTEAESAWAAITNYHRVNGLTEILSVLEAGMFSIKVQLDSVPGEGSLLDLKIAASFLCPHVAFSLSVCGKRERESES